MRKTTGRRTAVRSARLAALGAGILLLAGCATGYSFVQPEGGGSGAYYTSEPYSGQGYYDYDGTGPYYAGTGGYGYYDGTWPYGGGYGYYDPGYYGYGSEWSFDVGISNAWNFPWYGGPWYTTGFPSWGCYSWRCGSHYYRHGHHNDWNHHHDHDSGSWRHGDPSSRPSDVASAMPDRDFTERRERAREISAWRHDHYVRSPRWGTATGRFAGPPARPAPVSAPASGPTSFGSFRAEPIAAPAGMPAPTSFSRAPRAAPAANIGRAMPMRSAPAPAVQPSARTNTAPGTKIR